MPSPAPERAYPDRALTVYRGVLRLADPAAGAPLGSVLDTEAGESLALTRQGGNPVEDAETMALAGQEVEAAGYRMGPASLRFISIAPAQPRPAAPRP